jgi:hypothetical protein
MAMNHIYMGVTSEQGSCGAGSFDWSSVKIYREYGEESSAYAFNEITRIIPEYLTGERRISFFVEKIIYQWMDPYMGAPIATCNGNRFDEMSDGLLSYVKSGVPKGIYDYFLKYYNVFIYLMAFIGGLFILHSRECSNIKLMLPMYFVGGFIFYLFWEQKSRYGMSFYICLFPIVAYSLVGLSKAIKPGFSSLRDSKKMIIAIVELAIVIVIVGGALLSEDYSYKVDKFYDYNEEPLHYVDSSYDDQNREIHTEYLKLNKGFYTADLFYESKLPGDVECGAKVYLNEGQGATIVHTSSWLTDISNPSHMQISFYIPYNNSDIQIVTFLDKSCNNVMPNEETWYILMNNVEIKKNVKITAGYIFIKLLILMIMVDLVAIICMAGIKSDKECSEMKSNKDIRTNKL